MEENMALSNIAMWNQEAADKGAACGTACGAGSKPAACGAGDKPAACGAGDKKN